MNSILGVMDRVGQIRSRFDTYFAKQGQTQQTQQRQITNDQITLNNQVSQAPSNQNYIEKSQLLKAQALKGVSGVLSNANNSSQGIGLLNSINSTWRQSNTSGISGTGNNLINTEQTLGGGNEWRHLGEINTKGVSFQQLLSEKLKVGTENSSTEAISKNKAINPYINPNNFTEPVAPVVKLSENEFPYQKEIVAVAKQHKLPVALVRSVVEAESGFNPSATSEKGAMGLMQLMPQTAKFLGIQNPYDVTANLEGGTRYLRMLLNRYEGDYMKALSAYNAGEGVVDRTLKNTGTSIPPYKETHLYVKKILNNYMKYSGMRS